MRILVLVLMMFFAHSTSFATERKTHKKMNGHEIAGTTRTHGKVKAKPVAEEPDPILEAQAMIEKIRLEEQARNDQRAKDLARAQATSPWILSLLALGLMVTAGLVVRHMLMKHRDNSVQEDTSVDEGSLGHALFGKPTLNSDEFPSEGLPVVPHGRTLGLVASRSSHSKEPEHETAVA